jgi:hypothetical protein
MLVVSKKVQESVTARCPNGLECKLKVTVLAIEGESVSLGYEISPAHGWHVCERTCAGVRPSPPQGPHPVEC